MMMMMVNMVLVIGTRKDISFDDVDDDNDGEDDNDKGNESRRLI